MRSGRRQFLRGVRRNRLALLGLAICIGLVVFGLVGPLVLPDPLAPSPGRRLQAPASAHPFGTDNLGREQVSRVAQGIQVTLTIAGGSVLLALLIGVPLGILAGFRGGIVDNLIMRVLDVVFAFPAILLAMAIVAILGPSVTNLILTIGVVYGPHFARVVRGPVLSVKEREFVEAARAIGAGDGRLMIRHVLPNVLSPILVQAAVSFSTAILAEAALSYLGLGTQPPTPSLGGMISLSRPYMETAWWLAVFPGLAIGLLVAGINLVGDALRDLLDPRLITSGGV